MPQEAQQGGVKRPRRAQQSSQTAPPSGRGTVWPQDVQGGAKRPASARSSHPRQRLIAALPATADQDEAGASSNGMWRAVAHSRSRP